MSDLTGKRIPKQTLHGSLSTGGSANPLRGNVMTRGLDGKSAYEYAVSKGYEGTEEEFAEKLKELMDGDQGVSSWNDLEDKPFYSYEDYQLLFSEQGLGGRLNILGEMGARLPGNTAVIRVYDTATGDLLYEDIFDKQTVSLKWEAYSINWYGNGKLANDFDEFVGNNLGIGEEKYTEGKVVLYRVIDDNVGSELNELRFIIDDTIESMSKYGAMDIEVLDINTETKYVTLDENFIPNNIARKSDIPPVDEALYEYSPNPVQNKVVTKKLGEKLDSSKLPEAIDTALAQAKASGQFDGKDGYTPQKGVDYFTEEDKTEIVNEVVESLDFDSVGGSPLFVVTITGDEENGYSADKTFEEIVEAYESGKIVQCRLYGEIAIDISTIADYEIAFKNNGIEGLLVFSQECYIYEDNTVEVIYDTNSIEELMGIKRLTTIDKTIVGAINEINEKSAGGGTEQVQADWNQNDTTAPDYVKNRPFGRSDLIAIPILEEEEVVFDYGWAFIEHEINVDNVKSVKVVFDGNEYLFNNVNEWWECGNLYLIYGDGEDSGEPLGIIVGDNDVEMYINPDDESSTHVITLTVNGYTIDKISKEFLPPDCTMMYIAGDNPIPIGNIYISENAEECGTWDMYYRSGVLRARAPENLSYQKTYYLPFQCMYLPSTVGETTEYIHVSTGFVKFANGNVGRHDCNHTATFMITSISSESPYIPAQLELHNGQWLAKFIYVGNDNDVYVVNASQISDIKIHNGVEVTDVKVKVTRMM